MAGLGVPLSTLRLWPYDRRRMTRGQDGWLGLSCTTLAFATPRRSPGALSINFSPAEIGVDHPQAFPQRHRVNLRLSASCRPADAGHVRRAALRPEVPQWDRQRVDAK